MKKLMISLLFFLILAFGSSAFGESCYVDSTVRQWLEERDRAAEHMVQAWAQGAPLEDLAADVAVIISNEIYVSSMCRDSKDFQKEHLLIANAGPNPKVATLPAVILERLVGYQILSPRKQFPGERR